MSFMGISEPPAGADMPENPGAVEAGEYRDFQRKISRLREEAGTAFGRFADGLPPDAPEQPGPGREGEDARSRYVSREITDLLERSGGAGKFNTDEIEKSVAAMYGHLQGHIQRGVTGLENQTNSLLRQKTDIGSFIRGENACAIVTCAVKDNPAKPASVTDVTLSVNIPDSALISPIFPYQVTAECLITDLLSDAITGAIDADIEKLKDDRIDGGLEELSDTEVIFAKLGRVEDYTGGEGEDPRSARYSAIAKSLFDRFSGMTAESSVPRNTRESLTELLEAKVLDMENIRDRGFNTAVNAITSILDDARMGYQYLENLKNARELVIREYADADPAHLPDERFQIRMRYYDNARLAAERKAYDEGIAGFETEVQRLWDVLNAAYEGAMPFRARGVTGFPDLVRKYRNRIPQAGGKAGKAGSEAGGQARDGLSFVPAAETEAGRMNRTCRHEKDRIRRRIIAARDRLNSWSGGGHPKERRAIEERLTFLEGEYREFESRINPYLLRSGLLLDVDITSIKRRKTTLEAMSNVLNEFLHRVSKGFQDAAFASGSRRQSSAGGGFGPSFSGAWDDAPPDEELPVREGFDIPAPDDGGAAAAGGDVRGITEV
jgi:hypothetical protein